MFQPLTKSGHAEAFASIAAPLVHSIVKFGVMRLGGFAGIVSSSTNWETVMKRVLFVLGLAGFAFGALYTPSADAGPLEDQFFQMDKSRDGRISKSEFTAYQMANGATERSANFAFENLRGDDNAVSLDEYRSGSSATRRAPQRLERTQRSNTRSSDRQRSQRRRSSGGSFGGGSGS